MRRRAASAERLRLRTRSPASCQVRLIAVTVRCRPGPPRASDDGTQRREELEEDGSLVGPPPRRGHHYGISGFLAGIAAIMVVARVGAAEPQAGTTLLLNSVAAVVLGGVSLFGGKGTILGPVVGALILQTLINGLTITEVPVYWQPIAVGSVVILSAIAFQRREARG